MKIEVTTASNTLNIKWKRSFEFRFLQCWGDLVFIRLPPKVRNFPSTRGNFFEILTFIPKKFLIHPIN